MTRLFPPDDHCVDSIHAQLEHISAIKAGTPFAGLCQHLTREQISTMVETAFWAGLRSNEGQTTRVRLALAPPEHVPGAIIFLHPAAYDEAEIAKLSSAVPPNGCLGVNVVKEQLQIWGLLDRSRVGFDTVMVEASEPGIVRVDVGPYRPYAVLDGRSNQILAATGTDLAHHLRRKLQKSLPTEDFIETQAVWRECLALVDLVRSILADGNGGAVLIVPSDAGKWAKSLNPFAYRFTVADGRIHDIIRKELGEAVVPGKLWEELHQASISDDLKNRVVSALGRSTSGSGRPAAIAAIAPFAGVDGAIVVTRALELLGFGAKIEIKRAFKGPLVRFQALAGEQPVVYSQLEDLGGTRHQSAARFVEAHKDALAIVVSQDRHVSVMHWEPDLPAVSVIRGAEWWL
ncbi:MAG: putative sensor domain DACNV-containing protein [Stellaceae bacterium]